MYLLYVTFPTKEEAMHVSKELLKRELIKCANVLPGMVSLYEWEDQLQEENEVVALLKTSDAKVELAIKHVEALHSYDCPCVAALPVKQGNPRFLEWVEGL